MSFAAFSLLHKLRTHDVLIPNSLWTKITPQIQIDIPLKQLKNLGGFLRKHRWTADALRYVLPPIKNRSPFCSDQLQRQIIH